MKTTTLNTIVITALITSNVLLGLFIYRSTNDDQKNRINRGNRPKEIIIEQLHFDDKQIKEYEKLIEQHRQDVRKNEADMRKYKQLLYSTLGTQDSAKANELQRLIAEVQYKLEIIHYNHFNDIRNICTSENQLQAFDSFRSGLVNLFTPPPPHR